MRELSLLEGRFKGRWAAYVDRWSEMDAVACLSFFWFSYLAGFTAWTSAVGKGTSCISDSLFWACLRAIWEVYVSSFYAEREELICLYASICRKCSLHRDMLLTVPRVQRVVLSCATCLSYSELGLICKCSSMA